MNSTYPVQLIQLASLSFLLTWSTVLGVVMGWAEVMADLVGQGQLGDLGRHPTVVVHESNYAWEEKTNIYTIVIFLSSIHNIYGFGQYHWKYLKFYSRLSSKKKKSTR